MRKQAVFSSANLHRLLKICIHHGGTGSNKPGALAEASSIHCICEVMQLCVSYGIPGRGVGKHEQHLQSGPARGGGGLQSLALTYISVFCFPHEEREHVFEIKICARGGNNAAFQHKEVLTFFLGAERALSLVV